MTRVRRSTFAKAAILALLAAACSSSKSASTTTTSTSAAAVTTIHPGTVQVVLGDTVGLNGPETLVASSAQVAAGNVTFTVKNTGTIDHEMIVLKTDTPFDKLPIVDSGDPPAPVSSGADKVDEAAKVGETGDPNLKAGETRTFTISNLAPGKYVLVCNIARHYALGMRSAFTVG